MLLGATIRENLLLADPSRGDEDLWRALSDARVDRFVRSLPQGLDTPLAERGATLSGGQRQRIALARAFLREAPILLLDEPATGLDAATERALAAAIDRRARGRTCIVIVHQLEAIRDAGRIIVVDEGRIVGDGRHEDLLADCPAYRRLWEARAFARGGCGMSAAAEERHVLKDRPGRRCVEFHGTTVADAARPGDRRRAACASAPMPARTSRLHERYAALHAALVAGRDAPWARSARARDRRRRRGGGLDRDRGLPGPLAVAAARRRTAPARPAAAWPARSPRSSTTPPRRCAGRSASGARRARSNTWRGCGRRPVARGRPSRCRSHERWPGPARDRACRRTAT